MLYLLYLNVYIPNKQACGLQLEQLSIKLTAGACKAYPGKYLIFFPNFSLTTNVRRKIISFIRMKATAVSLEPLVIYPALTILLYKGERITFDSTQAAEDIMKSLSQKCCLTDILMTLSYMWECFLMIPVQLNINHLFVWLSNVFCKVLFLDPFFV